MTGLRRFNGLRGGWSIAAVAVLLTGAAGCFLAVAQEQPASSYAPVVAQEKFEVTLARMAAAKPAIMKRQMDLLNERYDLSDRAAAGVAMSRGKGVQEGVRVQLPAGAAWQDLAALTPAQIKERGLWPRGFLPLPHPNHAEGGMVFPQHHIDEIKRQTGVDLTRFDLDYDLPIHFLPEYPPAMFLTTRPDLGDVSQGKVVTIDNYFELFNGILNPKQLEGLRLLITPFPQQQFNQTEDRRSARPHRGVTCFDCHVNGHSNATTHLVGDIRPQEFRHGLDTPSLRGVNIQRLFGSQRALKSIEDFTEFEQRAAYFDGDPVIATKKGVNILERGSQVHFMAEFQALLDFPPAPKLDVFGKLDEGLASEAELRGQEVFFTKGRCAECHPAPYYTDNLMHNLRAERFFAPQMVNGRMASADGPIKTFPLRGIKESPPYLHDRRLLTLEDTVEFFNLVTDTKLSEQEKADLVAFMRCL
ncbi:MAG: cytochrome B6 [Planctomycetes bacterium]|nr:cytochrome B6 [Planctomycetota bacterium]